nr:hypothetical protein [Tanacetum cinerariifolium]
MLDVIIKIWKLQGISTYENEDAHIFESVYATEYIPLSRRGAGHESKGYESTVAGQVAHNQQGFNAWRNGGIQGAQNAGVQSGRNQNELVVVPRIASQNGTGNVVAARAEGTGNGNQPRCYNCRGLGIQLQAEEFDFMAVAGDLDEIKEVNANCILMANLQQASTSESWNALAKRITAAFIASVGSLMSSREVISGCMKF